jgi:hypothetical protein
LHTIHGLNQKCIKIFLTIDFYYGVRVKWVTKPQMYEIKGKGKVTPLQAWTGPEGSRRLRLPDFKTSGT